MGRDFLFSPIPKILFCILLFLLPAHVWRGELRMAFCDLVGVHEVGLVEEGQQCKGTDYCLGRWVGLDRDDITLRT